MEFKDFDMSEYFRILDEFKKTHTDQIVDRLGSLERFDEMLEELKYGEEIAKTGRSSSRAFLIKKRGDLRLWCLP